MEKSGFKDLVSNLVLMDESQISMGWAMDGHGWPWWAMAITSLQMMNCEVIKDYRRKHHLYLYIYSVESQEFLGWDEADEASVTCQHDLTPASCSTTCC